MVATPIWARDLDNRSCLDHVQRDWGSRHVCLIPWTVCYFFLSPLIHY
jgi:hypothetical protein